MLTAMWDNPAASIFALLGAICFVSWPLCRTRRGMLLVQLGIGIGFGLHYALWGSTTAAVVNGLGAIQTAAALLFGTSPRLRWLGYALIPAVVGACAITWNGLPSLLAAIGQTLMALGRMQVSPSVMRVLVLSGVLFWVAHDMMVRSPLLIADLLTLAMGVVALLRQAALQNAPSDDRPLKEITDGPARHDAAPLRRASAIAACDLTRSRRDAAWLNSQRTQAWPTGVTCRAGLGALTASPPRSWRSDSDSRNLQDQSRPSPHIAVHGALNDRVRAARPGEAGND